MPRRQIHPDLATFAQWRMEAQSVAANALKDNQSHPALALRLAATYMEGYVEGRLHQWRMEQELAVFREYLDKRVD